MFSCYSDRITNLNMKYSFFRIMVVIVRNLFYFYDLHTYHPTPSLLIFSGLDFQSMDTSFRTTRSRLLCSDAELVVKRVLNEKSTRYHCVSFKKFRTSLQGGLMKSIQFENY